MDVPVFDNVVKKENSQPQRQGKEAGLLREDFTGLSKVHGKIGFCHLSYPFYKWATVANITA